MPETEIKKRHDRLLMAYPIAGRDLVTLINICEIYGDLKMPRTIEEMRDYREMARDMVHKYAPVVRQILFAT